jgi:hypothetical protein
MLREIGGRTGCETRDPQVLKVNIELENGVSMEIVKNLHDVVAVLVFLGVAMSPRAIVTYFASRAE